MNTTARTALLGLLVSASLQSLAWADDPTPGVATVYAPNASQSSTTPPGAVAPASAPAYSPLPPPPSAQSGAGHVSFASQPATPTPANNATPSSSSPPGSSGASGGSQQPGQVSYDTMSTEPAGPTWNNPFGVGEGPFGPTFFINGNFGRGVGWDSNSYQAELYYPWHIVPGQSAVFGVLEGGVDDFGRCYTTGGVGYREYSHDWNRIQGFWGFVDYDDTHDFGFTRWGVSYENLGKYFDVRFNAYILNSQTEYTVVNSSYGSPYYSGYYILQNHIRQAEAAYDGCDLEIGGPLPFIGRYGVNGYIGPYYVQSAHAGDGVGVQGRINVAATDNLQVNVQLSEDPVFNQTAFVNVSWTLPDGVPTKWFSPTAVVDRLNSMVWRKDRIPVNEITELSNSPLLNPETGAPVDVIHVNPNLPANSGNGTAQSPYGSLQLAENNNNSNVNIILIQPRTDGTGTNLTVNSSFQLFNDQNVFGTTTSHSIVTLEGTIKLPGTTTSGVLPLVSNINNGPGTDVFELASRDQISGLAISGANAAGTSWGNGIGNPAGPIVGFNINQNSFTNYLNAVDLENATGTAAYNTLGLFANNATGQIVNNKATALTNVSQNGFEVQNYNSSNTPGTLTLTETGNTSTGNAGNGFLTATGDASQTINATFTKNTATANGTGFQFTTAPGTINLAFNENTASDNIAPSTGVHIEAEGGTINVTSFVDNTVSGNLGNGVWLDANSIAGGGTINVTNFQGNTITDNGTAAVPVIGSDPDGLLISANGSTAIVNAAIGVLGGTPNNISNNGSVGVGGAGIHVYVTNEGTVTGSIVNNNIDSNVEYGINFDANAGQIGLIGAAPNMAGAQPFIVDANSISANGSAGIFARLQSDAVTGSMAGLLIENNSIVNTTTGISTLAAGDGIHVITDGNSFLWNLNIIDNFIGINQAGSAGPNAGNGITIQTYANSAVANTLEFTSVPTPNDSLLQIVGNEIRFNDGDGINFQRYGDSTVNNVNIFSNNVSNNLGNGLNLMIGGGNIDLTNNNSHLTVAFFIEGNNLSNNGTVSSVTGSGAVFTSSSDADFRVTLGGTDGAANTINGNILDGVLATTEAFSQIEGTWSNNTIEENGKYGIAFVDADQTGPAFNVVLTGNFIEHNVSDGINFQTNPPIENAGGNSTLEIISNTIKANGGDGINIEPSGTSVVNVNIVDNLITANTLDGVAFTASGLSVINSTSSGNTITNNGGDGLDIVTATGVDGNIYSGNGFITATFTDNLIENNSGDGINILNQWNGQIDIAIEGSVNPNTVGPAAATNVVSGNGLDGILVENASDLSLTQNTPLNYWGGQVTIQPIINLTINQTEIAGNGTKATTPDGGDGVFIMVGTSEFGYINALVTNNHFSGNANIDFVTQSFVTTKAPATGQILFETNGTINTAFQPTPLARLALTLTGNVGNTIDVTLAGATYSPDPDKTITGIFDGVNGVYEFQTPDPTLRVLNAQAEPGAFNQGGTTIDGGQVIIGGIWGTYADGASPGFPDTVSTATTPSTTAFSGTNGEIIVNNNYVPNSIITFLTGPDGGEERVITGTTATNQVFTVTQAWTVAPVPGNTFTVATFEQSGTGLSTFVTDSGPSVNTSNHFATVISDFSNQVDVPNDLGFGFTWTVVAPGSFGGGFP